MAQTNREKQRLAKYEREKKTPFVTLNDGVCRVYKLQNVAEAGLKPRLEPTLYRKLNFAYQTIGVKRNYEALQAMVKLDEMIEVLLDRNLSSQDIVVINDVQYEIKQVQHKKDTHPETSLLSLMKLEENYDSLRAENTTP